MSKKRIMIVDDDEDILEIVAIILEINGYDAIKINTGHNFVKNVLLMKPEIIILDVQLGSIDGRTLCKSIKEIEAHWHIPIILCSANVHYQLNAKEYLCDDFIGKPFEMTSLIEKINRLMMTPGDVISAELSPRE